jgi:hypothetical protein
MKHPILLAAGLGALIVGTCAVTGVSLVPTRAVLGPCLKDWTSPVSYHHRESPLASVRFQVADAKVELCYGRPAMRGRPVFGHLVPWDSLWRLGANEPTRLYTDRAISLAGIPLAPGRYSLYVAPHPGQWTLHVSRSILHWGNDISAAVRAKEVGQAVVPVEALAVPAETLTVSVEEHGNSDRVWLVFEWERTRVPLEVTRSAVPTDLGLSPGLRP